MRLEMSSQDFAVIRQATRKGSKPLRFVGHGHEGKSRHFLVGLTHTRGRDGVGQEISVLEAEPGL